MSLPSLVLWLALFPLALLFGVAGALGTYFAARPRNEIPPGMVGTRPELLMESWRLVAIVAAVPAGILAAELALWGLFFTERVSLAYTGLAQWLGLVLLALVPVPLVMAAMRQEPLRGWRGQQALALAVVGLALFPTGWIARDWTWGSLAEAARRDDRALHQVLVLKGYQFISYAEVRRVLERSLATTAGVLDLVDEAQGTAGVALDGDVRAYLADRLDRALLAADPAVTTAPELTAVPAMWWLTADPDRTLQSYALSVHEFRGRARARAELDAQVLVADALSRGSERVAAAVLAAAAESAASRPLSGATIAALAKALDRPSVGTLAQAMLLRDASAAALRPIVPRFAEEDAPVWDLVRSECPSRTSGLKSLVADPDPNVASGAGALLAYVRQYCATSRPQGQ